MEAYERRTNIAFGLRDRSFFVVFDRPIHAQRQKPIPLNGLEPHFQLNINPEKRTRPLNFFKSLW